MLWEFFKCLIYSNMNTGQLDATKLTCISCRKKRKLHVQLTAYQLNTSLGIFMCTTNECLYPLNTKNLHRFVYKISPSGEFQSCDPSEVPNLKDLFALLSANANSDGNQTDPLPCHKSLASPNVTPPIIVEVIPKKEEVKAELPSPQSKIAELVPKEETCESYGAKFGASSRANVFPIWENKDALCWLDSTLCLLVHSKNLKTYFRSETFGECQLKDISIAYDEAVSILNSEKRCTRAKGLPDVPFANLEKVRERTFNFLQPFQKCEKGQEDSPVFAIMVLLKQNRYLHRLFLLHFSLELKCDTCGYVKISQNRKTLVTIPSVLQDFSENRLTYLRPCFQCQKPDQKIALKFVKLPPLLLMHFVEGLPHSNISVYDLVFSKRGYCVRGFVQYREPERHFITWVRDGDHWMCCDDLNPPVQRFEAKLPDIAASEIHIVMWEQKEINGEENFHLHYSGDENCNDSLSSIESASPLLIVLDDSDSETETGKSRKLPKRLNIPSEQVIRTNDAKAHGERTVSTTADKQQEEMVNDNSLSSLLRCKVVSSPCKKTSSISKELNHVSDSSLTPDVRQTAYENLSDGQRRESYYEEQEDPVQNKSPDTQKYRLDSNFMPIQKSCSEDGVYDDNGHSDGGLILSGVSNQNISGTDGLSLSAADGSQSLQFAPDSEKQDEDIKSTSLAHANIQKNDKSVKQDEDINSKSSTHTDISGNDSKSVNRVLGTRTHFVGSSDICERNQKDKLNLREYSSPVHETRSKTCAGGQRKVYAENSSSEIRQIFKRETVRNQDATCLDQNYDEKCKSVRECYVAVDRLEVEAYTKTKLVEQNTVQSTRIRRGKCAQVTAEYVESSSVAPAKCKEQSKKRKAASLLKQCSFDAGLQDTSKTAESVKPHGVHRSNCGSSSAVAPISAEKFAREQKNEPVESSAPESPAHGHVSEHSSNLSVPETESKVCPDKFSLKREQANLDEISQKVFGEQRNLTVLNDISDCSDINVLSSGSLSVKQSVKENCKELDAKNTAPSKLSVISDPITDINKNQSLALNGRNLTSVQSASLADLNTTSKTASTCGPSDFKTSSPSDLSEDVNFNVDPSNEVSRGDVAESKGKTVSTSSCEEGCTCDICSVIRFLHNNANNESVPQVLEKASEIYDVSVYLGSSGTKQNKKATVIGQNRGRSSSKKTCSAKSSPKDAVQSEENSDHSAVHNKMPSRKSPASKQSQRTVARKEISKNTANKSEPSQEHRDCVNHFRDKDLNVLQVSEVNDGDISIRNFETAIAEPPQAHKDSKSIELGHSEQVNIVSPSKKHKTTVKAQHLTESSVQGNLKQSLDMASPAEQEEVCESVEKQAASEQINRRVMYKHFGRQNKLCVGNTENNNEEAVVENGKPVPCGDFPISKRGKKRRNAKEGGDISHPASVPKKLQRKSNKLNSTGSGCLFLGDDSVGDSVVLKQKVERKFEPDSVQFVEVPVDSQSSDAESVGDEGKDSEIPQAVTAELKNSSPCKKTSAVPVSKNVIKYKGITAVFEPFVEDGVTEFSSIVTIEEHISFNGISSSRASQSDESNTEVSSCESEKQDVVGDTNLLANGVDTATPIFDSVDLLRAHLSSESNDSSEQTISGKVLVEPRRTKTTGKRINVSCAVKSSKGGKKLCVGQKESKKGRKKSNDGKIAAQRSSKQHREQGNQELHCDTAVHLGQAGTSEEVNTNFMECEYSTSAVKKDKDYLTAVKKMIFKHNVESKCHENQHDLHTSQDLLIPTRSPVGNEVTMDTSETEEKNHSPPCQIQDHNSVTKGILPERKGKRTKTVRFSLEPNDSVAKPGRKKIKGTSASKSESSVLQKTVHEKAGIKSTVSQEFSVKKRNIGGTSGNQRKRVKSKSPVSAAKDVDFDKSEKQGHQSSADDKPVITKAKQGNSSQDVKSTTSNKPLGLMNPFVFFPKDLTLNHNFSVSVPRPQVTKITSASKGTKSSEVG